MAKDGTARGGPRPGQGRPKKPLNEKISSGKPIPVLQLPDAPDIESASMPPVKEYLKAQQKNGVELCAEEVYKETWEWLNKIGCSSFVNTQLINQYAMSVARQVQCEEAISEYGFIAKHPTTNNPIQSPFVAMSQSYMKQVNQAWYQIFQIVREQCTGDFSGPNPQTDTMERLLRARQGGR